MIAAKEKQVICFNQLRPEPVEWLWPGRLAAGKLALLDGVSASDAAFAAYYLALKRHGG